MREGKMNEIVLGVGACIFLIFFLFTGIEIAFGILMVGFVGYALLDGFDAAYCLMVQDFFDVLSLKKSRNSTAQSTVRKHGTMNTPLQLVTACWMPSGETTVFVK